MASSNNNDEKKTLSAEVLESVNRLTDVDVDYAYSRDKYREILDAASEILPEILQLAKDSEHPRAFEVAFNGMRQMADINDKLLNMQRKKQVLDSDGPSEPKQPLLGHNEDGESAVFEGSVSQLLTEIEHAEDARVQDAEYTEKTEPPTDA